MNADLSWIFERVRAVNNQCLSNNNSAELLESCINLERAFNHQLKQLNIVSSFERICDLYVKSCNIVGLSATKLECEAEELSKQRSLIRRARVKNSSVQLNDEIQKIIYRLNNDYKLLTKESMPIFQEFIRKYNQTSSKKSNSC